MTFIALPIAFSPIRRRASSSPTASSITKGAGDLPRDLQSAESTRHLLVAARGEDAVAKLGEGDDADGNLVGEGAERSAPARAR